jgi:hypothetical protein
LALRPALILQKASALIIVHSAALTSARHLLQPRTQPNLQNEKRRDPSALHPTAAGAEVMANEKIAAASIPADQRFSFKVTPLPGRLLDAMAIGKSITALASFHASLGKDIEPAVKWGTYILGAELEPDGSFRLDVTVLPIDVAKPAAPKQPGAA